MPHAPIVDDLPAERLIDIPLGVGEGPTWDPDREALWFVDIVAPTLFLYHPGNGQLDQWTMPSAIGSFGLCPDGRLIVALKNGIHYFEPSTGRFTLIANPEADIPGNRMNDGKVGPDGAFWVGSMDDRPVKEPTGSLYRVTPDGACTRVLTGLTVSNGLAWTPDGRTMYHSDSRQRFIQAFDFDPTTGAMTNGRRLREQSEEDGRPDGAAGDAAGHYWSAGVSAGCLNCVAVDGALLRKVRLPLAAPTMPCFSGPDLTTLYVTSLTSDRLGTPQAGTLARVPLGVAGARVCRFGEPLSA